MAQSWHEILISQSCSIRDALRAIDRGAQRIALVVGPDQRLLGTVTDGDVRRGLLRGLTLDAPVGEVMNTSPTVARVNDGNHEVLAFMKARRLQHIPVVDADERIVDLWRLDDLVLGGERPNLVVLMAGGLGSRLAPLTDNCPKPMLKVGGKPLLDIIISNLVKQGFRQFLISLNYRAEMIMDHFGDGSSWGARITYLKETRRLGTAGALTLLPDVPAHPVVVMNADLLTTLDFGQFVDFHSEHEADATMCIREYSFQIPYGVVKTEGSALVGIEEKPIHAVNVSAGIYVLSPSVISRIPHDQDIAMPTVFESLLKSGASLHAFPLREYWCDIGRIEDLDRANRDFERIFS